MSDVRRLKLSGVALLCMCAVCIRADAGPQQDAAMAVVERGKQITPTGDLDGAMGVFSSVEQRYPEETEAIGWARWWIGNCLLSGWRLDEVRTTMEPVWQWVGEGKITNPEARFLFGHQYARVLNQGQDLCSVTSQVLDFYADITNPDLQMQEKWGFLKVFESRCLYEAELYSPAASAGLAAWEKGVELGNVLTAEEAGRLNVKPGVLAAWGRFEQAKAEMKAGNKLEAIALFAECKDNYRPAMERIYQEELDFYEQECRWELGMHDDASQMIVNRLISSDESGDVGIRLRGVCRFAASCHDYDKSEIALAPIAVARSLYTDYIPWNGEIDLVWKRKVRAGMTNEDCLAALIGMKDSAGPVYKAAINIQIADLLADLGRPDEAIPYLDEAESLSSDARLIPALKLTRVRCEQPESISAAIDAYEEILASAAAGGSGRIRFAVAGVREGTFRLPITLFGDWLEEHRDRIPDVVYRLNKADWLRDNQSDPAAALDLVAPLLVESRAVRECRPDRFEVHMIRIVALYQLQQDESAKGAVRAFEKACSSVEEREHGYFEIGKRCRYRRDDVAEGFFDRAIASGVSPTWTEEALYYKGKGLKMRRRFDEARETFERLAARPPSNLVGHGKLELAGLLRSEFEEFQVAGALYEEIAARPKTYQSVLPRAYKAYAAMQEKLGDYASAIEICDRGVQTVPESNSHDRGELRLKRAWLQLKFGNRDAGIAEFRDLAESHSAERIRRSAGKVLVKEGI